MNLLIADQYVRDHTQALRNEAVQARLVREARARRRRNRH